MTRLLKIMLCICLLILSSSCSISKDINKISETNSVESSLAPSKTSEVINEQEEILTSDNTGYPLAENTSTNTENINVLIKNGLKIFEDQSFSTRFENFGEVRFISGGIESDNPFELRLYLTNKNGDIIYSLSNFYGNQWPMLVELSAVGFKDVNKDGLKDIVIIAYYMTGVGEHGADEFPVAGIYFQKEKEFVDIPEIDEQINEKDRNENIDAVVKYINSIDLSKYNL